MSSPVAHLPFLAFVRDAGDVEVLKQFVATHGWPETSVVAGDIKTAAEHLKSNPSPTTLLVEVPSAQEAPALLDALAEVCDPDTKVIIIGGINEYSFYCWLTDIGIANYMLKPLKAEALAATYVRAQTSGQAQTKVEKPPAKVITVMGTRGGTGESTIALNLAGIIAETTKKNVGLVDIDPHEGSLGLALDLEPSRGFREALEKPDRIDALFIDRVVSKPHKYLSVLSAEETLQEQVNVHEQAADALLKELRAKFDVVVLDIPRHITAFSSKCLAQADYAVLVAEPSLASLRDTLRLSDLYRDTLKIKPPIIVLNRVGLAAKHEVKLADFEKGVNAKVAASVPFAPDIFMPVGREIAALKHKAHAAVKPLYQLAQQLLPEVKSPEAKPAKSGGLFVKKTEDKDATK